MKFTKSIIIVFGSTTLILILLLLFANFLDEKITDDNLFSNVNLLNTNFKNNQQQKSIAIDSIDFTNENSLIALIKKMDSLYPNQNNQRTLSYYYTDSLSKKLSNNFLEYEPNYLNAILNWAVNFKNSAKHHKNFEPLLTVISDFWVSKVNNCLHSVTLIDDNVKYTFKHKYLVQVCKSLNSNVDINITNTEKIINNILEKKWSYLLKRFYSGTSFFFKFSILLIILVVNYSLIFTFTYNYKKIISNEKNK